MDSGSPEQMLTGREAAALLREWMAERYPPELVERTIAGLAWKDSDEPQGTRAQFFGILLRAEVVRIAVLYYPRDATASNGRSGQ